MTGILLIGVALAWLIAVLVLTRWVSRRFRSAFAKVVCALALFPTLLVAPLADELIGMQQFAALCKKYAVQVIDEKRAMNRRVVLVIPPTTQFAEGTAVRIRIDPFTYRDEQTNEVLISFHMLNAKGGWLIRALGISETSAPLLFRSGCAPPNPFGFQKAFNIKVIN